MHNATPLDRIFRRALLAILVLGLVGMEAELLLLKHTDGVWQLVPVALIGVGTLVSVWCAVRPGAAALRTLNVTMLLFVASGFVGVVQHFRGNVAYAQDSNPSLAGAELYQEALVGATPALAPGAMLQLGLIGLLFAFRHPAERARLRDGTNTPEGIPR